MSGGNTGGRFDNMSGLGGLYPGGGSHGTPTDRRLTPTVGNWRYVQWIKGDDDEQARAHTVPIIAIEDNGYELVYVAAGAVPLRLNREMARQFVCIVSPDQAPTPEQLDEAARVAYREWKAEEVAKRILAPAVDPRYAPAQATISQQEYQKLLAAQMAAMQNVQPTLGSDLGALANAFGDWMTPLWGGEKVKLGGWFETYMQAAGQTLVPPVFHRWASLSLVAAACSNRVWIEKLQRPLYPNLYVMLIGPSGCGKGVAIDVAIDRWQEVDALRDSGRLYRGPITKQRMLDLLGGRTTTTVGGKAQVGSAKAVPQPWVIAPELYNALGQSGRAAEAFIANLTDLYTGSSVPVMEGTRTWGDVSIVGHCINWLAGTTSQWLRKSLSPDAILSGFFGRVITVEGSYSATHQEAVYPPNYNTLTSNLAASLAWMCTASGPCSLDEDASSVRDQWLATRQPPEDEMMRPAFQRDDDLLLKLATLLCVADASDLAATQTPALVITPAQIVKARLLVQEARAAQTSLVTIAHTNPDMDSYQIVRDALFHAKRITHTAVLRRVTNRGVNAERLRVAVRTLQEEGRVRVAQSETQGRLYEWIDASKPYHL